MAATASAIESGTLRLCGTSLLFLLLLAPLRAEPPAEPTTPDRALAEAQFALSRGLNGAALERSVAALKRAPRRAAENLQMALALFWAEHFEDSARYLRRALADDAEVLASRPPLRQLVPSAHVNDKVLSLAKLADNNAELCFLTGAMLVLDRDNPRALPFLVHAEELAGTDGQAGLLLGTLDATPRPDRNLARGLRELQEGDVARAQRSFAFAALDRPALGEAYAGWALALAAAAQDNDALRLSEHMQARCAPSRLCAWLAGAKFAALGDAAVRLEKAADTNAVPAPRLRLAMVCYYAAGYYASAQRCGVALLLHDKLDQFTLGTLDYMSARKLNEDPFTPPTPVAPAKPPVEPETPHALPPVEAARKALLKADYAAALHLLEPLVGENQRDNAVFFLVFVGLVGRGELIEAGSAFQVWFLRSSDDERVRANALRELFGRAADYDAWLKRLTNAREADLAAALPRMMIAFAEICDGKYASARANLSIALRAEPKNTTLQAMDKLMSQPRYADDANHPKVGDAPDPAKLLATGEKLFRERKYADALAAFLQAAELDARLKGVGAALLKAQFAMAEYDRAAGQLLRLLEDLDVANKGAEAFNISVAAGYADSGEFDKHLGTLKAECESRELASGPWLLYGAILYGKRDYNGARDALQRWRENARGEPNKAVLLLLESAKKLAR